MECGSILADVVVFVIILYGQFKFSRANSNSAGPVPKNLGQFSVLLISNARVGIGEW